MGKGKSTGKVKPIRPFQKEPSAVYGNSGEMHKGMQGENIKKHI